MTGPDWEPMKGTLKQALDYINKNKPNKDHFMMQGQIPNDFQIKFDKEKELNNALKDLMSKKMGTNGISIPRSLYEMENGSC